MPRLAHDRTFRRTRDRRTGSVAHAQRMSRVLSSIEPCAHCQLLDDSGNVNAGQPARPNLAVPRDRAEQRPRGNARPLEPRLGRPDRTRIRIRAIRNPDLAARAILIRLAPP